MKVDEARKEIKISPIEIINFLHGGGITLTYIFENWPDDLEQDEFLYDLWEKKMFEDMEE